MRSGDRSADVCSSTHELCIVTTGDTIDKIYFDNKSDFQVGEPQIGRILQELGVAFRFNIIPILRKDSLHLTDHDRELICDTIGGQATRHVLVTHGSDSRVAMCQVLSGLANKHIVQIGRRSRRASVCLYRWILMAQVFRKKKTYGLYQRRT